MFPTHHPGHPSVFWEARILSNFFQKKKWFFSRSPGNKLICLVPTLCACETKEDMRWQSTPTVSTLLTLKLLHLPPFVIVPRFCKISYKIHALLSTMHLGTELAKWANIPLIIRKPFVQYFWQEKETESFSRQEKETKLLIKKKKKVTPQNPKMKPTTSIS